MISDNIPIFDEYPAPDKLNESTNQLIKLCRIIRDYKAVITLNQAFLLDEYESNLRGTLHKLLEDMYNESLSYGLENTFFTEFVITEEHITNCNIDEYKVQRFNKFQKELQLIETIKLLAGGCNCETI